MDRKTAALTDFYKKIAADVGFIKEDFSPNNNVIKLTEDMEHAFDTLDRFYTGRELLYDPQARVVLTIESLSGFSTEVIEKNNNLYLHDTADDAMYEINVSLEDVISFITNEADFRKNKGKNKFSI